MKKAVVVAEWVAGMWKVTRRIADPQTSEIEPMSGPKDVAVLEKWWEAGWRLDTASGFPMRSGTDFEGGGTVERVLLVVEHD